MARVAYNDFLPSAAFSLTPALQVADERLGLAAYGSWLHFESGNNSLQGSVTGSARIAASPSTMAFVSTEIGGSRYENFASFSQILARTRVHFPGTGPRSGWIGAMLGGVAVDGAWRSVQGIFGALQLRGGDDVRFTLSSSGTVVGGTSYTDVRAGFRATGPRQIEAVGALSLRAGDPDGRVGPYVEGSLRLPVTSRVALMISGGNYPADLVRGSVAGDYLIVGIRLTTPLSGSNPSPHALPSRFPAEPVVAAAVTLVEVRAGRGDERTLVFSANSRVEVMGDFTEWLPIALEPAGRGHWSLTLPITPGRHRLNVRVGGGDWIVPAGTTAVQDDFQGRVGTIVIP